LFYFKDEWLACQRSWQYLESIFSAPDIERQLPNESKMFLIVDKSFKGIMQKTAKVRIAHWFSSVPPGIFQDNTSIRQWLLSAKSFSIHY
jgi:dynein heavy chain